jgi:hypothetical protein
MNRRATTLLLLLNSNFQRIIECAWSSRLEIFPPSLLLLRLFFLSNRKNDPNEKEMWSAIFFFAFTRLLGPDQDCPVTV